MNKHQLICIDSQIVIWGIKKQSTEGQQKQIRFAKMFFNKITKEKRLIITIPAIVVCELFYKCSTEEENNKLMSSLKNFQIADFNILSAKHTSKILKEYKSFKENENNQIETKGIFKFDSQIIGTALSNNCECIISNDKGLRNVAQNHIKTYSLEEWLEENIDNFNPNQSDLFENK